MCAKNNGSIVSACDNRKKLVLFPVAFLFHFYLFANSYYMKKMHIDILLSYFFLTTHFQVVTSQQGGSNDGENIFLFPQVCSRTITIQPRILGGENATINELPWMLRIEIPNQFLNNSKFCGGFLIDWSWALTAAHCLHETERVIISAGRVDYSQNSPTEVIINLTSENFHIHPQFNDRMHDIALIRLPERLENAQNVHPICILGNECMSFPRYESENVDDCGMVFTAGWGTTELTSRSQTLQKINMTTVRPKQCSRALNNDRIGQFKLCAIGEKFNSAFGSMRQDACRGDSGGPLYCNVNGIKTALGIVSYGRGCGHEYPGVYTRICFYNDWIRETIVPNFVHSTNCTVPRNQHTIFKRLGTDSAITSGQSVETGFSISLICEQNFYPNISSGANVSSTCDNNGEWNPPIAKCVSPNLRCNQLPTIANGKVSTSNNVPGSVAMISCNNGYAIVGANFVQCLTNGQWSAPNAECRPIIPTTPIPLTCGSIPNISNGFIFAGSFIVGTSREIGCVPNYILQGQNRIYCLYNGSWSEPGSCEPGKNDCWYKIKKKIIHLDYLLRNKRMRNSA